MNKTGLAINIKSKSLLQQAKNAAGQGLLNDPSDSGSRKAVPYMFSFPSDEHQNRAILKVGDSSWSRPQSLDAIGSNVDVVLPSATKQTEIHIGITIQEGEEKVRMLPDGLYVRDLKTSLTLYSTK